MFAGAPRPQGLRLTVSVVVIIVHHLGYPEFRGRKLPFAVAGCAPLSLAYLHTMNPLAATLGHSLLYMGAVLGGIELPPHQQKREQVVGSMMLAHYYITQDHHEAHLHRHKEITMKTASEGRAARDLCVDCEQMVPSCDRFDTSLEYP